MAFGKKVQEEIFEDPSGWILDNEFANFVLFSTDAIKYMCLLGYTFLHGCKLFPTLPSDASVAYKFVRLIFQCTGGGILVPIFINSIPVVLAQDSYPIAIVCSFLIHTQFPIIRDVVKESKIFKVCLYFYLLQDLSLEVC